MTKQIDYRNGLDLAKLAYRFFLTMGKTELPSLTPNCGSLVILDRENPEVIVRLTRGTELREIMPLKSHGHHSRKGIEHAHI